MFSNVKGQKKVVDLLKHAMKSDRVAQSYLFHGEAGVGKFMTALYFSMALNCSNMHDNEPCGKCNSCQKFLNLSHPDLMYIFPTPNLRLTQEGEIRESKYISEYHSYIENKRQTPWLDYKFSASSEIRIDSIRLIQFRLSLTKNEAKKRICIIEDADKMNNNTANAFLKTLEEPPSDTVIILITTKPNALLPTILSRCQKIAFNSLSDNVVRNILVNNFSLSDLQAQTIAKIAYGNVEKAIQLSTVQGNISREISFKLINWAFEMDEMAFLHFLTSKENKTKKDLKGILLNLAIFSMDIIYFHNVRDEVINVDSLELLETLTSKKYVYEKDIYSFIEVLHNLQRQVDGNVNPTLILSKIYNELKELIR